MAADVGQYFGLEAKLADSLTVPPRLLGSRWRRELKILDTELVESFGDGYLGFGVEEGIGKLLALCTKPYQRCERRGGNDKGRNLGEYSRLF